MAEDENALLAQTDTAMRRKFEIVKKTEILKLVTPEQIQAAAALQDMDIEIQIVKNKKQIVIPSDKAAVRELLDFLCQARFIGPLTQELFIANSYRPVGKKIAAKAKSKATNTKGKITAKKKAVKK